MKKIRIPALLLAICLLCLSLASCAHTVKMNSNGLTDKKTGITYNFVTEPLVPKEVSEAVYAVWKMSKDVKVELYEIKGLDASEWLYSEVGDLLCSKQMEFPDLSAFSAEKCFLCYNSDVSISFAELTDEEEVQSIIKAYKSGNVREEPMAGGYNTYTIMFESVSYSEFYYKLMIRVYEDATYMFNRATGEYVDVGDIFADYLPAYYESEE